MTRLAIAGGPKTGKTTMSKRMRGDVLQVLHTDDVMRLGWSEASAEVSDWFNRTGPLVVEGVAVPRALRKWLQANATGRPVDKLIVLREPKAPTNEGQRRMASGIATVLREIAGELRRRGVSIDHR